MRAEEHRELRHALGAYVLGDLEPGARAAVEAHLEGCPECREEAESLGAVGRLLPLADPARFEEPAPRPPAELGERVAAEIGAERERLRTRRRRRGFGLAFGGVAAATAAVVLAIVLSSGGGAPGGPERHIVFADVPQGIEIDATLQPHAFGTEIQMYVSGVESGTLCRVFLRDEDGTAYSAGSFRYRWGEDSEAVLSSALDLSSTEEIGVHAGGRTFIAPVGRGASAAIELREEDA